MPLTIAEFVTRWKIAGDQTERQVYQQHFADVCALLGEPTPVQADPSGETYAFEKHVSKTKGGKGFADVWKRGHFAWEYKGKHKDLRAAYVQLQDYRVDLMNPPLLVVSDFNLIRVHTNFANTVERQYEFTLDDLKAEKATAKSVLPPLTILRALFGDFNILRPDRTSAQVTEEAAQKFLRLAQRLELEPRAEQPSKEEIAHFLMRVIFCLFADSIGLLPQHIFRDLIGNSRFFPTRFRKQLRDLFRAMSDEDEGYFGQHTIPWFNGGLFNDSSTIELNAGDMGILHEAAANLDWAHIEPAIFGTLFERSLDVAKRSLIGAHYTSPADILLLIEPVVLQPLTRRWHTVRDEVTQALAAERAEREATASKGARHPRLLAERRSETLLAAWIGDLTAVRILDPACGSGNFLYMALRRMLDLWKEANDFAREQGMSLVLPGIVSPTQLFGIETDFYAHELASIVVWIGFLQWKHEHAIHDENKPILRKLTNIQHADAILRYTRDGTPYEPEWPPADYIIGNPPFLGGNRLRKELGDKYVDDLFDLYRGRIPAFSDLVCYWFEQARLALSCNSELRVGLIATQGIRGGVNRKVLQRIKTEGDIFLGWSDRNWILNGATVHISLIAFDGGQEKTKMLNGSVVQSIHANLTSGNADTTTAIHLQENENICFMGPSPKGPFDIDQETARKMLSAPANVNGRKNVEVVRQVESASDLVGLGRRKWTIDFGSMDIDEAKYFEMPFEYVRRVVLPVKAGEGKREKYAEKWWQYGRPRTELRQALVGLKHYIATPAVAKHRIFVWRPAEILANQGTLVFASESKFLFGLLQSRLHDLWARQTGTQLRETESGFRYTPTSVFGTFPFPWPPGTEPEDDSRVQAIAAAAKNLVDLRDRWLHPPDTPEADLRKRTLTNLYNEKPQWLQDAHQTLDRAVFAAYTWPPTLTDQQILERLLALNHQRAQPSTKL